MLVVLGVLTQEATDGFGVVWEAVRNGGATAVLLFWLWMLRKGEYVNKDIYQQEREARIAAEERERKCSEERLTSALEWRDIRAGYEGEAERQRELINRLMADRKQQRG